MTCRFVAFVGVITAFRALPFWTATAACAALRRPTTTVRAAVSEVTMTVFGSRAALFTSRGFVQAREHPGFLTRGAGVPLLADALTLPTALSLPGAAQQSVVAMIGASRGGGNEREHHDAAGDGQRLQ